MVYPSIYDEENSEGVFLNYTRVIETVGKDKFNLAPRKWLSVKVSSDEPAKDRESYNERMKDRKLFYSETPDGLTKLPSRSQIYN